MGVSKNEHTGDRMVSGPATDAYQDGWERIWGSKKKAEEAKPTPKPEAKTGTKAPKVGRK